MPERGLHDRVVMRRGDAPHTRVFSRGLPVEVGDHRVGGLADERVAERQLVLAGEFESKQGHKAIGGGLQEIGLRGLGRLRAGERDLGPRAAKGDFALRRDDLVVDPE